MARAYSTLVVLVFSLKLFTLPILCLQWICCKIFLETGMIFSHAPITIIGQTNSIIMPILSVVYSLYLPPTLYHPHQTSPTLLDGESRNESPAPTYAGLCWLSCNCFVTAAAYILAAWIPANKSDLILFSFIHLLHAIHMFDTNRNNVGKYNMEGRSCWKHHQGFKISKYTWILNLAYKNIVEN